MITGILFTGYNIDRVLKFCGDKASYYSELHVNSIKEKRELVVPTDFLFKSSKDNIRVVSWKHFFNNFKQSDLNFEVWKLSHPFIIAYKDTKIKGYTK